MAARAAAARNNKQKKRRHDDGVNVRTGFGFVIIELLVFRVVMDAERTFIQSADNASSFFRKFYTLLRTHLINGAVMLSEAKHLCLSPLLDRSRFDPRFFAPLRMTS